MKVSVVMPTWNQGDHIKDALDSIQSQTFKDFELILVIDGPADAGTKTQLDHEAVTKEIHNPTNKGTATALNVGFSIAIGEYLTWVSSDNVMHPDWLEKMVKHLDTFVEDGAVYSSYRRQEGAIVRGRWVTRSWSIYSHAPTPLIDSENCYIGPAFLYRANLHHEHQGAISHDYDWWLRFEEKAKIGWIDNPLCTYRAHQERVTITRRDTYDATHWRIEAIERRG